MHKTKRIRKLIKHCKMNKAYAMYQLGLYYEIGLYVYKNHDIAYKYMQQAAALDYQAAIDWLKDYYFDDDCMLQAYI